MEEVNFDKNEWKEVTGGKEKDSPNTPHSTFMVFLQHLFGSVLGIELDHRASSPSSDRTMTITLIL
jgi:hypothetical protein